MTLRAFELKRAWTYGGLFVGLCLVWLLVGRSSWQGSTELHTIMEVVATLSALVVGLVALVRFYTRKSNTYLFIATGFLGTALLDGYHSVVTSSFFDHLFPSSPPSLIPWSWNASRTFLAILMTLSWLAWLREEKRGPAGRVSEKTVYVSVAVLTIACFFFFAFVPLPRAYYPQLLFGRPQEFLAASFFLVALLGYLKKRAWTDDAFEHWLVMSLIVGVVTQAVFMSRSFLLFDIMFDMAHLLKQVSYSLVFIGLLINMYHLFGRAERSTLELSKVNLALQSEVTQRRRAEEGLRELNVTLAGRVEQRTAELAAQTEELKGQRTAALSMMEDANEAKERAQRNEQALGDTNRELKRANTELEQFAYVASHDLREPLRMVASYLQLLEGKCADRLDGDAKEFIGFAVDGAMRMRRLIDDLLSYSRVGTRGGKFERTDAQAVLANVVRDLQSPIDETGAAISHDALPTVFADPSQLGQLFQNLIGNALKFRSDQPPQVHLGATRQDGQWLFSVRDNGIGIEPEFAERIFAIFQRLHGREEYSGTGLGLAICKKIVERHGGRIWVESAAGEGTTFVFTLPVKQEAIHHERHAA